MKCFACGYEHKSGTDFWGDFKLNLKGDKPFIRLSGIFSVLRENGRVKTEVVEFFECPVCGTFKTNREVKDPCQTPGFQKL